MYGAIMFTIMNIAYLPIVVYVPALAFNQVTGVNIHVITPIVCIVCVFYTCVVCLKKINKENVAAYLDDQCFFLVQGGLKAVVWTDVVQTFSMFGALVLVAIKGTKDLGGIDIVLDNAWTSGRIEAPM